MEWTTEQRQVIEARRSNLIVSAAAGSGKTAVLVERICTLVMNENANIERMLIATFTRAAASEMRSRILDRLASAAAEGNQQSRRLNDQLLKIDRAPIGTLHAFCGDLLRQYYNIVGIEPSFKTEDESITSGIFDEALEDTIEDFFESGDPQFVLLADCWGGRDGNGLKELVTKVYNAARNYPDYSGWLKAKAEQFNFVNGADTPWYGVLRGKLLSSITLARESLEEAIKTAGLPHGLQNYLPRMAEEQDTLARLHDLAVSGDMEELSSSLNSTTIFGRLPAWKDTENTGLGERTKKSRDEAKKQLNNAKENPIICGFDDAVAHTKAMYPQMKTLQALIEAFDSRYAEQKRYSNVLDFSDLEHMALAVLEDNDARTEIQSSFDYLFVDEYQDISPIQDEILRRVSKPGSFFCVGDIKQSIYRFRSAEPEIFINRLEQSSRSFDVQERRIDLNRNFRSAERVISLANYLFGHLMSRPLGGVEYAGSERLELAAPQPSVEDAENCANELIFIDNGGKKEDELTWLEEMIQIEREATVVAHKIKEIVGRPVWDGKAGINRKLQFQDITILLRTVSSVVSDYAEVFRRSGIPVYAEAEGGFADELEVQLLMNLLRLIDNAYRDFELLTSMHSTVGCFSLEDLLEIRGLHPSGSVADAVYQYAAEDTELAVRVKAFLDRLNQWRALASYSDIEKLIFRICDETGFYDYAGTLPEGERRQANITYLGSLARDFSGGLYDFIQNFDRLAAAGARNKQSGQPSGAVSIMSVHKSKGLEFPVVILSNVGKPMNLMDTNESMLIHSELGLGPRYFNADKRTRGDTLARAALSERIRQDTLSEEMRMLYVAVTRARERLIIVGTVSNFEDKVSRWSLPITSAGLSSRARCWADWLGPMALRTRLGGESMLKFGGDAEPLPDSPENWQVSVINASDIKSMRAEPVDKVAALDELMRTLANAEVPEELVDALEWQYPWGDVAALPSKVSATSLLDKQRNWRGPIPAPEIRRLPRFMEEKKSFAATDLGTFVHTALQLLPTDIVQQEIPAAVVGLEQRGLLPEGAASAINMDWIERFFRSDIASRMRCSGSVQRELPFNLAIPVHIVYAGETSGEEILVQGIIDCCFMEDGQWVLLDYKTNRVDSKNTAEKIAEYYKPQLQTYRTALEEITGIGVKEAYLFLLSIGAEVQVKL
jgi:ATP-dependent helicase/nuclease subunit A